MKEQLEQRLSALKIDYEAGQKMLVDLETRRAKLREILLRINGAVQVLEEELGQGEELPPEAAPAVPTPENDTQEAE